MGRMASHQHIVTRGDVKLAVTDRGGTGHPVILLHGLAGSSRELLPTADALVDSFRVLLIDQRGHGDSTRRPDDLSRQAFVDDVVAVIEALLPGQTVALAGQSMGAHTAFLTAAARPDLIDRLVMLEAHVAGGDDPQGAAKLEAYFDTWPQAFADAAAAREFLGPRPITEAWIADFDHTPTGLRRRFDADIMRKAIAPTDESRWSEWESLAVPTLAIFAEHGMFSPEKKDELFRRRPATRRGDIAGGSHDAHLDRFDEWISLLRAFLSEQEPRSRF